MSSQRSNIVVPITCALAAAGVAYVSKTTAVQGLVRRSSDYFAIEGGGSSSTTTTTAISNDALYAAIRIHLRPAIRRWLKRRQQRQGQEDSAARSIQQLWKSVLSNNNSNQGSETSKEADTLVNDTMKEASAARSIQKMWRSVLSNNSNQASELIKKADSLGIEMMKNPDHSPSSSVADAGALQGMMESPAPSVSSSDDSLFLDSPVPRHVTFADDDTEYPAKNYKQPNHEHEHEEYEEFNKKTKPILLIKTNPILLILQVLIAAVLLATTVTFGGMEAQLDQHSNIDTDAGVRETQAKLMAKTLETKDNVPNMLAHFQDFPSSSFGAPQAEASATTHGKLPWLAPLEAVSAVTTVASAMGSLVQTMVEPIVNSSWASPTTDVQSAANALDMASSTQTTSGLERAVPKPNQYDWVALEGVYGPYVGKGIK